MIDSAFRRGAQQAKLHFFQYMELVLNILVTHVFRQFLQKRLNLIFWITHKKLRKTPESIP